MTAPSPEKPAKSYGVTFFCYLATIAFVLFPVLTIVGTVDGTIPKDHMMPIIATQMCVGIVALLVAIFLSFHADKSQRTKNVAPEPVKSNVTLREFMAILAIVLPAGFGLIYLTGDLVRNKLAESMASESNVYDMSSAQDAKMMVEAMIHPVERAVLVEANEGGKHALCAVDKAGALEVFTINKTSGSPMLRQYSLNNDLKAAAPAFCSAAFARLDAATINLND